jgi:hypothetical protein
MQTETLNLARAPIVGPIVEWWRRAVRDMRLHRELDECDDVEVARIASDLSVSPADLRALARHDPREAELLYRRMVKLGLDRAKIARAGPATMRDLQRLCTLCEWRGRCIRDLADEFEEAGSQDWQDYCPNAATLTTLSADRSARPD